MQVATNDGSARVGAASGRKMELLSPSEVEAFARQRIATNRVNKQRGTCSK
jgi:hypothetical protein